MKFVTTNVRDKIQAWSKYLELIYKVSTNFFMWHFSANKILMDELTGIAKTLFDETMDEIDEELTEALEAYIVKEKLEGIIADLQESVKDNVTKTIMENYSENMSTVKKMILGEKLARVVAADAKSALQNLVGDIIKQSFDVVEELRNEIIGEVFEETAED